MSAPYSLKGSHYRSEFLYTALTLLKLGPGYHLRYRIAARYIHPKESVIDVCSGSGGLKYFIPKDCPYTAVEASPEFSAILQKKGLNHITCDLHAGLPHPALSSDVIVMLISLCQFRNASAGFLLESFKKMAKRVVIIEDVLSCPRSERSLVYRAINYLCATDYCLPFSLYTRLEFTELMRNHGYACEDAGGRYMVGSYGYDPEQGEISYQKE
ncbi:MAG: hypothetical protein WC723_02730 [Candidatus Omnitrophota bacterium]